MEKPESFAESKRKSRKQNPPNLGGLTSEIQRSSVEASDMITEFKTLTRDVHRFSSRVAQEASMGGRDQSTSSIIPQFRRTRCVPTNFDTVEAFIFYYGLATISFTIYDRILRPLHPLLANASQTADHQTVEEYKGYRVTNTRLSLATRRSHHFSRCDAKFTKSARETFVQHILDHITSVIYGCIPNENYDFPSAELGSILSRFCDWNTAIKRQVLDFDLVPFLPESGSRWDGKAMEPLDSTIWDQADATSDKVAMAIQIGLMLKTSLGANVTEIIVVEKAMVFTGSVAITMSKINQFDVTAESSPILASISAATEDRAPVPSPSSPEDRGGLRRGPPTRQRSQSSTRSSRSELLLDTLGSLFCLRPSVIIDASDLYSEPVDEAANNPPISDVMEEQVSNSDGHNPSPTPSKGLRPRVRHMINKAVRRRPQASNETTMLPGATHTTPTADPLPENPPLIPDLPRMDWHQGLTPLRFVVDNVSRLPAHYINMAPRYLDSRPPSPSCN